MSHDHADYCCPTDPVIKEKWESRLEKEKDKLIAAKGEKFAERELMLKTLSHTIRLNILSHLEQKPNCVCELVRKLGASNSAVSYHLSYLARFILIRDENRSGNVFYSITDYGQTMMDWLVKMPFMDEE